MAAVPKQLKPFLIGEGPTEDGEWEAYCPLHEDSKRSASFNFEKGVWHCFAGCQGGTIQELAQKFADEAESVGEATRGGFVDEPVDLDSERTRRRGGGSTGHVSDASVSGWHEALLGNPDALAYLAKERGLSLKTIKRFSIGWDRTQKAFTIPIRAMDQSLYNVRRYRPATSSKRSQYWNIKGMGKRRLFPEGVLAEADDILLCEGEWDCILANQMGFPAVTSTGGAANWTQEFNPLFEDKRVTIMYDADETGDAGARRAAHNISKFAREVRLAALPFDKKPEHGDDLTDYVIRDEMGQEELSGLLREAKQYGATKKSASQGEQASVSVLDSFDAKLSGKPLEIVATITGKRNPPYQVPAKLEFNCSMDAGQKCAICPMLARGGEHEAEVEPSDPIILEMIDTNNKALVDVFRRVAGAVKCNKLSAKVSESRNVEELFARPSIEKMTEDDDSEYTNRKVLSVGRHDTSVNRTFRMVGTVLPNPKSQRAEFLSWDVDPTESDIDAFKLDAETRELLSIFQPGPGQTPLKKCGDIAKDLESNVTHIVGRPELHIAMDLVYHSALSFRFAGTDVPRGWLDLLVLGDTRTGKSAVAEALIKHYSVGRLISCESASFAGIVGGLQQFGAGREWTITWGAIPLNDRRIVVMDEVSGLTTDQIAQMSSIRSSGVAQLTKIQEEQTTARTRLIWLSNPRHGALRDYTYAHQAISELIGNPEDVARFDFAMSVSADDVPSEAINRRYAEDVTHRYTKEACQALVYWAWSRKADDITFTTGAEGAIFDESVKLGLRYVEDPPLIQSANVRIKLARIAVALAARTYSTDKTGSKVVVRVAHVRDAVTFMDWLYSRESFGYAQRSQELLEDRRMAVSAMDEITQYLKTRPGLGKFLRSVPGGFRRQDMEDMMNFTREETTAIINKLWLARMVQKQSGGDIRISPLMHQLLREVKE